MPTCPLCRHTRTPRDPLPEWKCPACGVSYAKGFRRTRLGLAPPPAPAENAHGDQAAAGRARVHRRAVLGRGGSAPGAGYTAFGQARVAAGSTVESNLRLPGQYFDQESGLHQNCLRYYEPQTGGYTQYDPMGLAGSMSGYAYADADPVGRLDPQGDAIQIAPILLGMLAGYSKCVLQCAVENAVLRYLDNECIDWNNTVQPCFSECASPTNWLRAPGMRVLARFGIKPPNPWGRKGSPKHQ